MDLISEIYKKILSEKEYNNSAESKFQSQKCQKLYEELFITLNDDQKKKLFELDGEYDLLYLLLENESLIRGIKEGVKLIAKLIIDSLRD